MSDLTQQQEAFAQSIGSGEFEFNWMSYEKCYSTKNMSKNSIYVEACKLQQNPKVALRIKEIQEATVKRNQVTLDEVLNEMALWLRFNTKSLFDENGCMKPIQDMTDEEASSIASYECVEMFENIDRKKELVGYLKKVRLLDKRAVAEMFLKKFGAYITTLKLDVEDLSHIKDLLDGIKK